MSNRSDRLISQCEGTNINEGSPDGRLVYIASPYAGDVVANTRFAIRCCLYAIRQGCTPVAPHLLYPQMLDDSEPEQRAIALKLGHRLLSVCQEVWACGSRISSGMAGEIALAETLLVLVIALSGGLQYACVARKGKNEKRSDRRGNKGRNLQNPAGSA